MTKQKTFKRRVRERMEKTGESYASARAALIGAEPAGLHPDTSALRFALADRGLELSEALTLIIAGGAGAAAMAFRYEAEDVSHFHLSGWNPFQSDVRDAVTRLGFAADIHETSGAKAADRALRERLQDGVQLAWVEGLSRDRRARARRRHGAHLRPHRADVPSGGTRGRVRKQRHRLLAIGAGEPDVPAAVRQGLEACARGPAKVPSPGMSLAGIARWADRLDGSGKDSWAVMFPPGKHRDGALRDMAAAIRSSGGGLLRTLQARGLHEAADVLGLAPLHDIAERTEALAREWEAVAGQTDLTVLATRVRALCEQEAKGYATLRALLL